MAIPDKPKQFAPNLAPAGVEVKFVDFVNDRPAITPDIFHFHTNGAGGEGSIQSAWNHAHSAPNQNTLPHYQLDRTHNGVTPCRKMLPTNLKGIGSTTVGPKTTVNGKLVWPTLTDAQRAEILAHPPNVSTRAIVIETADTGYLDDPGISAFDDGQLELGATILAYESIVHGLPLQFQPAWWQPGAAPHTDPAGFPFTTIHRGKICPGLKKKAQVPAIIARAREIVDAWTNSDGGDDDMTPEQAAQLKAVHDALLVKDPTDGTMPIVSKMNQTHSIMKVLWDGFPGNIIDGPGTLARSIKRIAHHLGQPTS